MWIHLKLLLQTDVSLYLIEEGAEITYSPAMASEAAENGNIDIIKAIAATGHDLNRDPGN